MTDNARQFFKSLGALLNKHCVEIHAADDGNYLGRGAPFIEFQFGPNFGYSGTHVTYDDYPGREDEKGGGK